MTRLEVKIQTRDGVCPASIFTPSNSVGPWPAVIFFMDGLGIRPAMWEMGQRLADAGYVVLLPDLYYRSGSYPPKVPAQVFAEPNFREELRAIVNSLTRELRISDAGAFIDFLLTRPEVKGDKFGATGYCMGGNYALTAAGAYPERFVLVASFHGGNLASDQPESPHLFLEGFKGRVYVAGAIKDSSLPDEQKVRLEQALNNAGVEYSVETYASALHGFAVPDMPVYNQNAAERHWETLLRLLGETFPPDH